MNLEKNFRLKHTRAVFAYKLMIIFVMDLLDLIAHDYYFLHNTLHT
jgi:hypothetical protein